MIYFLALIPATALTIAGYFVLYLSNRSEGSFRTFGKYLSFWAFTLAGLVILGAIFAAAHHGGRYGANWHGMRGMHERMYGPWPGEPFSEARPGATPQSPDGAKNPTAPPAPSSPSPK